MRFTIRRGSKFTAIGIAQAVNDGTWYGGTPLWVLAEQQGMRAACFFWPGSEADIQGVRPSYYMKYDAKYPNEKRVEQVLAWLRLPAAQRPHFITLYFSEVDSAGHAHGPDSEEVAGAVHEVDKEIGRLEAGLATTETAGGRDRAGGSRNDQSGRRLD